MTGWKTWAGAALVFVGYIVRSVGTGMPEYAFLISVGEGIIGSGLALLGIGLGHKIEKGKN